MKPFETLDILRGRMSEALIAQSGIRHPGLNAHLRRHLASDRVEDGALLRPAIIEGAFPFETGDKTYGNLAGSLLHPSTVDALTGGGGDESVPGDRAPYKHQIAAWNALSPVREEARSVLVTAGTGSGKTECFLVPMLDDLVRQDADGGIGDGVQAIMLYPLNALIASQQERLDAWTSPLKGRLRYALYNGLLDETHREAVERQMLRNDPQMVPNRRLLRESPPPLLVTNLTMLEYMLMRAADAPIIEKSKGRLRWIVLDEAHTLVGAAAAEVALLLRRVMDAFAVDPKTVRFVATSATIGAGAKVKDELRRFLADIGGVPSAQVEVIEGHRQLPHRPPSGPVPSADELRDLPNETLFDRLGGDGEVWALVERLKNGTVPAEELAEVAADLSVTSQELAMALTRARSNAGEVLAPLRVHALHRAVPGLWSCANPHCDGAPADWPQGRVFFERIETCPTCEGPVAELRSCNECGGTALFAEERLVGGAGRKGGRLVPPGGEVPEDEFSFEAGRDDALGSDGSEGDESEEPTVETPSLTHCIALQDVGETHDVAHALHVDAEGRVSDVAGEGGYRLQTFARGGRGPCPLCGAKAIKADGGTERDKLFPFRFGTPFVMGNAVPVLADAMPRDGELAARDMPSDPPVKPLGGRQLISFTDSRQGTARLAAKLQGEAERAFARSYVYQSVQRSMEGLTGPEADAKWVQLATFKAMDKGTKTVLKPQIEALEAELASSTDGLPWDDVRNDLALRPETEWLLAVWGERALVFREGEDPRTEVARMLLLREFLRRPRLANSLETLGLARLRSPAIDAVPDGSVPSTFREAGGTPDDWRAWLMAIVTFQLRANGAVRVPLDMATWVMRQAHPKQVVQLRDGESTKDLPSHSYAWPRAMPVGTKPRAVELLEYGLGMSTADMAERHLMSEWLSKAWQQLTPALTTPASDSRGLEFSKLAVAPLTRGFVCPVTHNWLDIAPFGLTPYARSKRDRAEAIEMPRLPVMAGTKERREWLASDPTIQELRVRGLWGDIHDRTALFAAYLRSAEHSAQLPAERLRDYERSFRAGEINVLNCSTTMEMGVDIGSVNGVVMTNVPPSIANYRQRVGRAGRRGQPLSLAFTIARDRPLDREAFHDPDAYLNRTMAAPRVALDSQPIVQRHVNALAFGRFMRAGHGDALRLKVGPFLGLPDDPGATRPALEDRPVEAFRAWLASPETAQALAGPIAGLVRGSVLEGRRDLLSACDAAMSEVAAAVENEWKALRHQAKTDTVGAAAAIRNQLKRLCQEFLPSTLADRGFLPGHGFPNHVVSFELDRKSGGHAKEERPDNRGRLHEGPKRPLDVAIREYAPGAEVVIDGQVHRSGGVTLNWQRPASDETVREIQDLRWMVECGECGEFATGVGDRARDCPSCGSGRIKQSGFLRPAGFLRDRHVKTHADVDVLRFIPSEDAKVTARDGHFEPLPLPELGRMRTDRAGRVLFHNRGPAGAGYGLCLRCGRMEPMKPDEDVCSALDGHKPLRAREGWSEPCPGNAETFAIKHGLNLGHEITTDVFELQPAARPSAAAAHALAIALREALAQELGIETSELGYTVKTSLNPLGQRTATLCLFDKPAGGAGYAIQAAPRLRRLLGRAREILTCSKAQCERACSACVLAPDAPERRQDLDRHEGLAFLDQHLKLPDDLPEADRFVPQAETSDRPLDEIDTAMRSEAGAGLTLWVQPDDITELDDWAMTQSLRRWTDHGRNVEVVLPIGVTNALDDAQRLFLRDYRARYGVDLAEGPAPIFDNGAQAFAAVGATQTATVWAARDATLLRPGPDAWNTRAHPIAVGPCQVERNATPLADAALKPSPGASVTVLNGNVTGPIGRFGTRMAGVIREAMGQLGVAASDRVAEARYEDRYARSPLVLRLLVDTVAALNTDGVKPSLSVFTRQDRGGGGYRGRVWHDVADDDDLDDLLVRFAKSRGIEADLTIGDPPHKRSLVLQLERAGTLRVDLDQGFGWLTYHGRDGAFDAQAESATRARSLGRLSAPVTASRHESQMVVHKG